MVNAITEEQENLDRSRGVHIQQTSRAVNDLIQPQEVRESIIFNNLMTSFMKNL